MLLPETANTVSALDETCDIDKSTNNDRKMAHFLNIRITNRKK